jgi:hypothetical protein
MVMMNFLEIFGYGGFVVVMEFFVVVMEVDNEVWRWFKVVRDESGGG